ncbi:MAG TPA: isochorismatase family cysteine hydrolase [Candidatus Acidoferrales bacterium]|nr:isochorismatase family cysteine hydrolase [Candidatus Acidoferrales bacterium]
MFEIGGKKIPATLAEIVDPKRTALLLWDMERAIAPNAFNYKEIAGKLRELSALARQVGVPVFYSVQTGFDLVKEEAGVWVRIRMRRARVSDPSELLKEKEDPRGTEIVEELKPQPQDIVFRKRRPDGFVGTDFDLMLRSKGTGSIVIGGVATEGGVEGTARTGRNLGYDVVILKDCVGSRHRELHEMALRLMEQTHFDIASAGEIAEIWRKK